jgi:serine/threonine protein kinase HipA of HipAB toxin-antitoxin module
VRHASAWAVSDLLRNRDSNWMDQARQEHEQARQALHELIEANFRRKVGRWCFNRR